MLDTSNLMEAAQALQVYIENVEDCLRVMGRAAEDCLDNMGSDQYSNKAAMRLQDCVQSISASIMEAGDLRVRILKKIQEIEESTSILT